MEQSKIKPYSELTPAERKAEMAAQKKLYEQEKTAGYHFDMSRGKPDATQLNLSMDILSQNPYDMIYTRKGTDVRNYGELAGVDEAKELFGEVLGVPMENIIIGGQSSLALMYDNVIKAYVLGVYGGSKPWGRQEVNPKFLCPVPGYDRHFRITEEFGIDMISIPMTPAGPDMELVRQHVENDASVKGIWCVPKYSNPQGYTYSPETVEAFAALKPAADDFRIFWDNAYYVHGFREQDDFLLNIFDACQKYGSEDMVYEFMSTSKVTFAGAGVAVLAASKHNIDFLTKQMSVQTLGYNKINQLRHVRYFGNVDGLRRHMRKQAMYLRPNLTAPWQLWTGGCPVWASAPGPTPTAAILSAMTAFRERPNAASSSAPRRVCGSPTPAPASPTAWTRRTRTSASLPATPAPRSSIRA